MKIFIPSILKYRGEKLTQENLEKFKKIVYNGLGTGFSITCTNDKLNYVSFYWGDSDYPRWIKVNLNEYFFYNTEDEEICFTTNEIKEEWIIDKEN